MEKGIDEELRVGTRILDQILLRQGQQLSETVRARSISTSVEEGTEDWRPYATQGGSRTWRGGNLPMGWEREAGYGGGRYDREFRGYGRDYHGPRR